MKIKDILSVLFVPKCVSCGKRLPRDTDVPVCPDCLEKWRSEKRLTCPVCGHTINECRCGLLFDTRHCVDVDIHLSSYSPKKDSVTKDLILCLKRKPYPPLIDMLGRDFRREFIGRCGRDTEYVVINVPRSSFAIREFGFDHAGRLADVFCSLTGFVREDVLYHTGKTVQKKLGYKARIDNARTSFFLKPGARERINGKNAVLIDDILTTGATSSRCAYLLKKAGAKSIVLMYIARAY